MVRKNVKEDIAPRVMTTRSRRSSNDSTKNESKKSKSNNISKRNSSNQNTKKSIINKSENNVQNKKEIKRGVFVKEPIPNVSTSVENKIEATDNAQARKRSRGRPKKEDTTKKGDDAEILIPKSEKKQRNVSVPKTDTTKDEQENLDDKKVEKGTKKPKIITKSEADQMFASLSKNNDKKRKVKE